MRRFSLRPNGFKPLLAILVAFLMGIPEHLPAQAASGFPMPNVVGLSVADAEARVASAGRAYGARSAKAQIVRSIPDQRPAGRIVRQLEPPGTPMRPYMDDVGGIYGQVTFRVLTSSGPPPPTSFPMPSVVGLTVPAAEQRVLAAGRQIQASSAQAEVVRRRSDARPAGQIIQQLESPGTPMRPYMDDVGGIYGQVSFRVVVSTGPPPAPDFVGRSLAEAERLAREREVLIDFGASQANARVPEGIVVRQNPEAGQPMPQRRVTVYASAGYPLPNFVERSVESARVEAEKLEFALRIQRENRVDVPRGVIFEQNPPAGTLLPLSNPVQVRVSDGWPVPEFVGRREPEAGQIAVETRIRLDVRQQDNFEVPIGMVFDQQPRPGELLPSDRVVRVTVSTGYPLPDLIGMHQDEAREIASGLNFGLDISRAPVADRIVDHVDRQSPEAGTRLPFQSPVRVVVSDGWLTPDFLTLAEDAAAAVAAEEQVTLRVVERRRNRESRPGIVIGQNPPPGSLLAPARAVEIVVSASDPTPRLIGLTEQEATTVAGRRDINLETREEPSPEFAPGVVADQSPGPEAPLPADGAVSAVISAGWPTPDLIGRTEDEADGIAAAGDMTLIEISASEHFELPAGRVIEQRPAAGALLPADRRIDIALSLGWPVAPDAVGRSADVVQREFLARHPNAIVAQTETLLTLEPAGIVVSQYPEPDVKLGPEQRLRIVSSAIKPAWLWPAAGAASIALALAMFAGLKAALGSSRHKPARTTDPGGVRLRVTKDHGVQATEFADERGGHRSGTSEIVSIRVNVDLGEQSAGPLDDLDDDMDGDTSNDTDDDRGGES